MLELALGYGGRPVPESIHGIEVGIRVRGNIAVVGDASDATEVRAHGLIGDEAGLEGRNVHVRTHEAGPNLRPLPGGHVLPSEKPLVVRRLTGQEVGLGFLETST